MLKMSESIKPDFPKKGRKMNTESHNGSTVGEPESRISGPAEKPFPRLVCVCIVLLVIGWAASFAAEDDLFDLKEVTTGVYLAQARQAHILNSNAAVIMLEDGVLVVDTHSKPSAARALIKEIKAITHKPVRYVVDTHFHYDHFQGNGAYREAFPGVQVIASEPTRHGIVHRGIPRIKAELAGGEGFGRYVRRIEQRRQALDDSSDPDEQDRLLREIALEEAYLEELRNIGNVLPTMSFEKSLVLRRGDREVQILFLGRGHTDGDTLVFLPEERILCTGDLVHGWSPYMPDSHPYDWIRTLAAVEKLDFDRIMSGHGGVLHGKRQVTLWRNYLRDLMGQVEDLYARGLTLEQIGQTIDLSKHFSLIDRLEPSVAAHVRKAYREISWEP